MNLQRIMSAVLIMTAVAAVLSTTPFPAAQTSGTAKSSSQPSAAQSPKAKEEVQKFLDKPGWQKGIDWAKANTGAPDCPQLYAATYPECLWNGRNRACLMEKAENSAKDNDCDNAYRLTVITQCHNGAAANELGQAGKEKVCAYLKQ